LEIQTEHLENQTARFTVEIDLDRLEQAKRKAARKIAQRVNIPGFRKGKVPYRILIQNGLEGQILSDAIEDLTQDIYRETLDQSHVEPYGPGSLEDVQLDPKPTFIYTVPLQPTVDLKEYRAVRVDYELPEVDDADVDDAMKRLQREEALVEESSQPVAANNRVTVDIHSEFADDPATAEIDAVDDAEDVDVDDIDEDDIDEDEEEPTHAAPKQGDLFIHEHDATLVLDPDDEPILPGFVEALVGANAGEDVEFELVVPEDHEDYDDIAGRTVKFQVTINKVEVVTLPELNDELAARITENEEEPLTLLQLRMRMRENIFSELERRTKDAYVQDVISAILDQADVHFPVAMVDDQIEDMIRDFEQRLRNERMDLETYLRVMGKTREELAEDYRETAEGFVARSLLLREIMAQEEVEINEEQIDARIDEMTERFGDQAEQFRSFFSSSQMRTNVHNELLNEMVLDRVAAIGRGEVIDQPVVEDEVAEEPDIVLDEVTDETEVEGVTDVAPDVSAPVVDEDDES
jgi:trigger factor